MNLHVHNVIVLEPSELAVIWFLIPSFHVIKLKTKQNKLTNPSEGRAQQPQTEQPLQLALGWRGNRINAFLHYTGYNNARGARICPI